MWATLLRCPHAHGDIRRKQVLPQRIVQRLMNTFAIPKDEPYFEFRASLLNGCIVFEADPFALRAAPQALARDISGVRSLPFNLMRMHFSIVLR
jgi:hypothetical protein